MKNLLHTAVSAAPNNVNRYTLLETTCQDPDLTSRCLDIMTDMNDDFVGFFFAPAALVRLKSNVLRHHLKPSRPLDREGMSSASCVHFLE